MDDLSRFFSEIKRKILSRDGRNRRCPFCSSSSWAVADQPNVSTGIPLNGLGGTLPVYTLVCEGCGFARQHVRLVVDKKQDKTNGGT